MGFILKKIVSALLYPLGLSLLLTMLGCVLWKLRPRKRAGFVLVFSGWLWLYAVSLPITSFVLLNPLERWAGDYGNPSDLSKAGVRDIVVLAGSMVDFGMSPADMWECSTLPRVMEGIRLFKGVPNCRLVLSGGSFREWTSNPQAMEKLPLELGVPREALVLETRASDTEDETMIFSEIVGTKPFALVTSAAHMTRSVNFLRGLGASPIPCPCDFKTRHIPPYHWWFIPTGKALKDSHDAVHEYLGIVWQKLKGW